MNGGASAPTSGIGPRTAPGATIAAQPSNAPRSDLWPQSQVSPTPALRPSGGFRSYLRAPEILRAVPNGVALAITAGALTVPGLPGGTPTPFIVIQRALPGTASQVAVIQRYRSSAYKKFKDVARWLGLSDAETARLIGVGRTTPYAWEREAREVRPSKAGYLFEYFALLSSILGRMGADQLQVWLDSGNPTPRLLLTTRRLAAAYDAAHEILFGDANLQPAVRLGALQDESPPKTRLPHHARPDELAGSVRRARRLRV